MKKPILYFDMDNVLVNFMSGINATKADVLAQYDDDGNGKTHYDDIPGIFAKMLPVEGAVEAVKTLYDYFDCYILSTAPWKNPTALNDKLDWVKRYFDNTVPVIQLKPGETNCGNPFYKKVIFTHRKNLCLQEGAWLIDDRTEHGASEFGERHIHFLSEKFPDWQTVVDHLVKNIKSEQ